MIHTLFAKDNNGQIRTWFVKECADGILISHGVLGGAMQEKFERIDEGLAGRTLVEQISSRAQSRLSKKIDSGYVSDLIEAENKERTNSLGYSKPMLAAKFDTVKKIDYSDLYIQYKYDGNRMLIQNVGGVNIAYTRNGKLIDTIPEILESICIPEGVTIDGEIYCHGESLQTIVSWVKRRQENSKKLRYHVYDIIIDDTYKNRLSMLESFDLGNLCEVVPTYKYWPGGSASIKTLLMEAIDQGYEGLILRQNDFGYEAGKRSNSLIKVKHFLDDEFKITGMHLSKDGLPILDLITDKGIHFKATMPGSMSEKHELYNLGNLVDKYCHLEYSQLTKTMTPFHPTATSILNYKDELK